MVRYDQIDPNAGVAKAFDQVGMGWADGIIAAAAWPASPPCCCHDAQRAAGLPGHGRDGLVPHAFLRCASAFRTPWKSTIAIGIFVGVLAGLLPIGPCSTYEHRHALRLLIVCGAVLIMRHTNPKRPGRSGARSYRWSRSWALLPACCSCSRCRQPTVSVNCLAGVGLCIYFLYGRHHSILGKELRGEISAHGRVPAGAIDERIKE